MRRRSRPARTHRARRRLTVLAVVAVAGFGSPGPVGADPAPVGTSDTAVQVTALSPRSAAPNSVVTVTGTITNKTRTTISDPTVKLQPAGAPTSNRHVLRSNDVQQSVDDPDCIFAPIGRDIAPSATITFRTSCSAHDLGMVGTGLYPLLVNVNGDVVTAPTRVGEATLYLPYFAAPPAAPTRVALVWPLVDQPHRRSDGVFVDDTLATELPATDRLGRLVQLALKAPPTVQFLVILDPELISEVTQMASATGYRVAESAARSRAGLGTVAARFWLSHLRALLHRPGVTVAALPYADPDLVAMQHHGLGSRIAGAYQVQSGSALAGTLGVAGLQRIAWPADGDLDPTTLQRVMANPTDGVILSADCYPVRPGTTITRTADAVALLASGGKTTKALVYDGPISADLAALDTSQSFRMNEQYFLNDLAAVTAERVTRSRSVLLVPPRRWNPDGAFVTRLLRDLSTAPYLRTTAVGDLVTGAAGSTRGPLRLPADDPSLRGSGQFAVLSQSAEQLSGLSTALTAAGARRLLTGAEASLLVSASNAWTSAPQDGTPFVHDLADSTQALLDSVSIASKTKRYTLASNSSPIVVTVINRLPAAVTVRVSATARSAGFTATAVEQTIQPQSRTGIRIPTTVQRSGTFTITTQVTTPGGQLLGRPVPFQVSSTAYGTITLGITFGALALLFILVCRRLYRRFRGTDGGSPGSPAASSPQDAPVSNAAGGSG